MDRALAYIASGTVISKHKILDGALTYIASGTRDPTHDEAYAAGARVAYCIDFAVLHHLGRDSSEAVYTVD